MEPTSFFSVNELKALTSNAEELSAVNQLLKERLREGGAEFTDQIIDIYIKHTQHRWPHSLERVDPDLLEQGLRHILVLDGGCKKCKRKLKMFILSVKELAGY